MMCRNSFKVGALVDFDPSTHHPCLKFLYNGTEVMIIGELDPFQYCTNLRGVPECQVSIN